MKPRLAIIGVVVATAWGLVLAGQRTLQTSPVPVRGAPDVVTSIEFAQIREGMTYRDCVRIIGKEGAPFGSSNAPEPDAPWPEWISFEWRNGPESYAMVSFHHGAVERTRAFNLE